MLLWQSYLKTCFQKFLFTSVKLHTDGDAVGGVGELQNTPLVDFHVMQKLESNVVLSPTDLANHLACKHLSWLNYHSLYGGARPSKNDDELTEILQQYGAEHEATYFAALSEQLAAVNRTIVNLDIDRDMDAPYSVAALRDRAALTAQSLSDGPNALYQPTFHSHGCRRAKVPPAACFCTPPAAHSLNDRFAGALGG